MCLFLTVKALDFVSGLGPCHVLNNQMCDVSRLPCNSRSGYVTLFNQQIMCGSTFKKV